jgi:hypothetical protein
MNPSVTFRPRARRDLLEQTLYLQQDTGIGARIIERHLDAVLTTCEMLAD